MALLRNNKGRREAPRVFPAALAAGAADSGAAALQRGGVSPVAGRGRGGDRRAGEHLLLLRDGVGAAAVSAAAGRAGGGGGEDGPLAAGADADAGRLVRGAGAVLGLADGGAAAFEQPAGGDRGGGRAAAVAQRRGEVPVVAGDDRVGGLDRAGGGHRAIGGDAGVEMGPVGEVAAVSAAAAGGVRGGLGDCGGLQCADFRGGVCGADRAGEFLDEPVCAAGVRVGGGDDGVAELLRHPALVHGAAV